MILVKELKWWMEIQSGTLRSWHGEHADEFTCGYQQVKSKDHGNQSEN